MAKFHITLNAALVLTVLGVALVAGMGPLVLFRNHAPALDELPKDLSRARKGFIELEHMSVKVAKDILVDPLMSGLPNPARTEAHIEIFRQASERHVNASQLPFGIAAVLWNGDHRIVSAPEGFADLETPASLTCTALDPNAWSGRPEQPGRYCSLNGRLHFVTPAFRLSTDPTRVLRLITDATPVLDRLDSFLQTSFRLSTQDGLPVYRSPDWGHEGPTLTTPITQTGLGITVPVTNPTNPIGEANLHGVFAAALAVLTSIVAGLYVLHLFVLAPLSRLKKQLRERHLPANSLAPRDQIIAGDLRSMNALSEIYSNLQELAITDPLTGLYNRVLFEDRLNQLIADSQREPRCAAILMLDMDRFKQVNDTLGHPVGDELLRQVAQRMSHALRETDTLARFGGDEFAILLPNVKEDDFAGIATKLRRLVGADFRIHGHTLSTSISIGASLYPHHARDVTSLVQFADIALYQAKKTQERITIYQDVEDHAYHRERAAARALSQAITRGELRLLYQPVLLTSSRKIQYLEALVRCPHSDLRGYAVEQIIALAERHGLIRSLTNWIIEQACLQLSEWRKEFPKLKLGINISMLDLDDPGLSFFLRRTLERHGLAPSSLILEISEVAIMRDTDRIVASLTRLTDFGVKLAIDDFGTGQTALRHLKRLPVQIIKIDKSFVMDVEHNREDEKIVRATIDLAQGLGITVTAEGVNTQRIFEDLIDLGCDALQGYFISRPLSLEQVAPWLRSEVQRFLTHTNLELSL